MSETMTIREWKHERRNAADWSHGPWDNEPDKIQWVDEATNLDCLIHRGPVGALCGYVGVAEGHPAFAKGYDDVKVDVHGGLTYADFCQETTDESRGICHVPDEGRPHRVWWLGFDCAHYMDLCPGDGVMGGTYRDRAYVESEIRSLAKQLAEMSHV